MRDRSLQKLIKLHFLHKFWQMANGIHTCNYFMSMCKLNSCFFLVMKSSALLLHFYPYKKVV